jgi:hypothetical protein
MDKKYFSLGTTEDSRIIKIIRIIFGIVCLIITVFWIYFNITTLKTDSTLWITIIFLGLFGFYQTWAGLGRAVRFIEIGSESILLKKNAVLPAVKIDISEIEKIDIYPLNIIFHLRSKKRILLRLGTTYHDQNELILDEIIEFAELNHILLEVIEDKI